MRLWINRMKGKNVTNEDISPNIWIDVKDHLPEVGIDVLIVVNEKINIAHLSWDRPMFEDNYSPFQYWEASGYEEIEWTDVTYWAELPAIPTHERKNTMDG